MTLNEAIQHCQDVAKTCDNEQCAIDYQQLKEWLEELIELRSSKSPFELIGWPDVQDIMELEGFDDNATLVQPNDAMNIGSSTYVVNKEWLTQAQQ